MALYKQETQKGGSGVTWRVVATIVAIVVQIAANSFWRVARGTVEGAKAADQLTNNAATYVESGIITSGAIGAVCWGVFLIILALLWVPFIIRAVRTSA